MTKQQKEDYLYGRALRLADELGKFDEAINHLKYSVNIRNIEEYVNSLEDELYEINSGDVCGINYIARGQV